MRPPIAAASEDRVRPDIRVDSVREAEEYAQTIIESYGGTIDQTDEFYIDRNVIPDSWSYEWKRVTVAGKEDPHYMVSIERMGWRAVPVTRHPEMMPVGWKGAIEKKGLRLMELPKVLIDRADRRRVAEAKEVLRNSDRALYETPANTASREEYPERLRIFKKDIVAPVRSESDN